MPPAITSWTQGAWIALDIILVALLIYQVLVMIRGTRAVPMLVGLTVLAILFYFAQIGELTTLNLDAYSVVEIEDSPASAVSGKANEGDLPV